MRTDIPAFYSKWFLNRIKEGYVCVRNPYNPKQVTKYSLSPEVVDPIRYRRAENIAQIAYEYKNAEGNGQRIFADSGCIPFGRK